MKKMVSIPNEMMEWAVEQGYSLSKLLQKTIRDLMEKDPIILSRRRLYSEDIELIQVIKLTKDYKEYKTEDTVILPKKEADELFNSGFATPVYVPSRMQSTILCHLSHRRLYSNDIEGLVQVVKFIKNYKGYNHGDIAVLSKKEADDLINSGFAKKYVGTINE